MPIMRWDRSLPLLNITTTDNTKYAAYADDISCVGALKNILTRWNKLNTFGAKMEYFPKANKSWLIVKPEKYEAAKGIFKGVNLNITNEGKKHLAVGIEEFRKECDYESNRIKVTDKNTKFCPQAAHCAFTSGSR